MNPRDLRLMLDNLAALNAVATPGPFMAGQDDATVRTEDGVDDVVETSCSGMEGGGFVRRQDRDLFVAMRNALPDLMDSLVTKENGSIPTIRQRLQAAGIVDFARIRSGHHMLDWPCRRVFLSSALGGQLFIHVGESMAILSFDIYGPCSAYLCVSHDGFLDLIQSA